MRRPCFKRWIRGEVLRLAKTASFNLRKLAAEAQRTADVELVSALLLYAHENDQTDKLMSYIYDETILEEYQTVEARFGQRSIERLALRGTPMMSLPQQYRDILERYEYAYHTPENIAAEKRELWETTKQSVLVSGISPAELANALELDQSNLSAYLAHGDIGRFTLATVRRIAEYVS